MNTEATDDASLNSGRNRSKSKPGTALYKDRTDMPSITMDDGKTPDSKAGRTISYNKEFDTYNKSRNDDAIMSKKDSLKYANRSEGHIHKGDGDISSQVKKRINHLYSSNDNVFQNDQIGSLDGKMTSYANSTVPDEYDHYFDQASGSLDDIVRHNPSLGPLLKLVRKSYEEVCHRIITDERKKQSMANDSIKKYKQEIEYLKRERNLLQKEKKNAEKEAARNYKLFKKVKLDIQKLDLDEYNLTSDDFRSGRDNKYTKGVEAKGHPLVPKLDFQKIYAWREEQDLEDGEEVELEEEEEEEELLTENEKYLFKGSELQSDASL